MSISVSTTTTKGNKVEKSYGSERTIGPRACELIARIAETSFAGERLDEKTIRQDVKFRYPLAALRARGLLTSAFEPRLTTKGKAIAADILDVTLPADSRCGIVYTAAPRKK